MRLTAARFSSWLLNHPVFQRALDIVLFADSALAELLLSLASIMWALYMMMADMHQTDFRFYFLILIRPIWIVMFLTHGCWSLHQITHTPTRGQRNVCVFLGLAIWTITACSEVVDKGGAGPTFIAALCAFILLSREGER